MILIALCAMAETATAHEGEPKPQQESKERQPATLRGEDLLSSLPSPGELTDAEREDVSKYLPQVWCQEIRDASTKQACWAAFRARFDYFAKGTQHRVQVFGWQYVSTVVIFIVVVTLVLLGMYFASVQFRRDAEPQAPKRDADARLAGEVELSAAGVRVKSPVLGVIILALSLGFFYLYLVFVYPIREIL